MTSCELRLDGVPTILTEIADVTSAIPAVSTAIADVPTKVALILTALTDILPALLAGFVVPDLARVLSDLATILTDLMRVTTQLPIVVADLTFVRAELTRLVVIHARMQRASVRVVDTLCAHEGRTSNEQGRDDRSRSEIAHCIPQRQYPALAVVTCACMYDAGRRAGVKESLSFRAAGEE
jgi:hypothetical protein